ncbi:DAK2 domain-containing protein [Streptomyces sp. bgisy100]|uniref:DAK2 domain-containing protein n=1 Tax=Streptomyces sp. bgisy100 TaxID=3413783 RepID=UPI003D72D9A5
MPHTLDATTVRTWCELALEELGQAREGLDAINVYPVADGDTGTNLYLTVESAARAVDAVFAAGDPAPDGTGPALADAVRAMAHGALIGARGNSGTILAQLLRGMAEVLADGHPGADRRPESGAAPSADRRPESGTAPSVGSPPETRTDDAASLPGTAAPAPTTGTLPDAAAAPAASPTTCPSASPTTGPAPDPAADALRRALRRAAESAYRAVAHPVEGTVLTVATAAADAAGRAEGSAGAVARAAYEGACAALDATPGQLDVLARAGVVDAGGSGLVAVLRALAEAVSGELPMGLLGGPHTRAHRPAAPHPAPGAPAVPCGPALSVPGQLVPGRPGEEPRPGPAYEVIYLLEASDEAVATLRGTLDGLGDSLVVVGGDGLWNVHVHVDDAGAAVEAGVVAGRPYRIAITHFAPAAPARPADAAAGTTPAGSVAGPERRGEREQRAVVAVVPGEGLAALCREAGADVVSCRPGERPAGDELVQAIRRAHAHEVVLLPNDGELRHTAAAAAEQARAEGVRVALIPTRSSVQGIAALAVHQPGRRFDEDVVAMTAAAGATRYAELAVAEAQSWTMAGVCQAGDVLGLIDGDVAVIGPDLAGTAATVLDRMLAAGGEMVTLVLGSGIPDDLADRLQAHVRERHLAVDTVVYRGGQPTVPLLIGVE